MKQLIKLFIRLAKEVKYLSQRVDIYANQHSKNEKIEGIQKIIDDAKELKKK